MSGLYTTEGIVFRSFKYGESSMIADIYSQQFGLRSYIAGSIRTKKSSGKANVFYPGNIVEITAYPASENKLSRLKEINYAYSFKNINQSVVISSVTSFLMEVCRKTIKEHEPNLLLYDFIVERLKMLDSGEWRLKVFHIKFLLELTSFLGFEPYDNYSDEYPLFDMREGIFVSVDTVDAKILDMHMSKLLNDLIRLEMIDIDDFEIEKQIRDSLLDRILEFYKYHVESFGQIKSLEVLRIILS